MAARRDLVRTRELVLAWGEDATSYQILNPGIRRWFSRAGDAVAGYVEASGFRVVAGSPLAPPGRLPEVVAELEDDTAARGGKTCYFGAEERLAKVLASRGPFDRLLLGAQPVWDPWGWPEIVRTKASLRAQLHRARNKGVTVERWPAERSAGHPELARCLDEWLATRGLPPLHFLVEPETLDRLDDRRVFVARRAGDGDDGDGDDGGQVVAFLVASPVPARGGWLVEQIVRGRGAPNGTSELLVDAAFRDLAALGSRWVTLGLAPLSVRARFESGACREGGSPPRLHPLMRFVLGWMRAHARRFYDFDGLDAFKAKLQPHGWEPVWAITSEERVSLRTLYAIAGAFTGTAPVVFVARALVRAVVQEGKWLCGRLAK